MLLSVTQTREGLVTSEVLSQAFIQGSNTSIGDANGWYRMELMLLPGSD